MKRDKSSIYFHCAAFANQNKNTITNNTTAAIKTSIVWHFIGIRNAWQQDINQSILSSDTYINSVFPNPSLFFFCNKPFSPSNGRSIINELRWTEISTRYHNIDASFLYSRIVILWIRFSLQCLSRKHHIHGLHHLIWDVLSVRSHLHSMLLPWISMPMR